VDLVVNPGQLASLLRVCGHETLRELFDMGVLKVIYFENGLGVRTVNGGTAHEVHDFVVYDAAKLHLQNHLPQLLQELIGHQGKARRIAERFKRSIALSRHSQSVSDQALEDITNSDYVREAISRLVQHLAPEVRIPTPFLFEVTQEGAAIHVRTNLNFPALNRAYHERVSPEHSTLTIPFLLTFLQDARSDLQLASSTGSELAISQATSIIAAARLEHIMKGRLRSEGNLRLFQEFVFEDSRAIREAVNSGQRNMQDVVSLVASAQKFRQWVSNQPEDVDLRRAYLTEVTKVGWAGKLPQKAARWGLVTAASTALSVLGGPVVGTAATIGLSALDAFIVDKLARGWKPNQFVEGPLRQFLHPGDAG
jgi:hypothetical protein